MQGLALAEKYFQAHGLPLLQSALPHAADRTAAGLVGDGSECFGFDDQISRDHDWGPGFCLWVDQKDWDNLGPALNRAYQGLPNAFEGWGPRRTSAWGQDRVGVFCIQDFYSKFTGLNRPPQTNDDWLAIPDHALAAATNGKVFFDPLKIFTRWREKLLAFYPEDVRIKKIAARAMTCGQSGQYNYGRSAARGDLFGAMYAQTKFLADALGMVFLLNKRYAPFYKWLHRAVFDLPFLGKQAGKATQDILNTTDLIEKQYKIEAMAALLIQGLQDQGLTDFGGDFLADHGPVIARNIKDPDLAKRNVWVG